MADLREEVEALRVAHDELEMKSAKAQQELAEAESKLAETVELLKKAQAEDEDEEEEDEGGN